MKTILRRCGICLTWHATIHCQTCGSYHVYMNGKHKYFNVRGVEMVRGEPVSLHGVIDRMVTRISKENEVEK